MTLSTQARTLSDNVNLTPDDGTERKTGRSLIERFLDGDDTLSENARRLARYRAMQRGILVPA
jgi:hypothetical protein